MLSFETALRLMIVGQEVLIAAVLLFGNGNRAARISGSLLLISVSAYVLISDPALREATAQLIPLLTLLAIIVPYCLWSFARAIFEAPWPSAWVTGGFAALAIGVWIVFLGRDSFRSHIRDIADVAMHVAALIAVGHALVMAAKGRPDDLIERRRRFRVFFVVIVAIQVGAVLAVELFLGDFAPAWLTLLNVCVIAALTIGLAIPLLRLDPEFIAPLSADAEGAAGKHEAKLSPAESVLKQTLLSAMSEGAYRQSGLTIRTLAVQLQYPEYQLRKLINHRLGYRNFSAFLNSYRIDAAKRILADTRQIRTPILTIALDLGYRSLGPFNRAFKANTNMTPTEYRRQALRTGSGDTE